MRTAVLSSASRISGTTDDCQVEIKDGLLDTFKQYRCSLRFFHAQTSTLQPLFLYIDGLGMQDFYSNQTDRSLFACINAADWIDTGSQWHVVCEPQAHARDVTVSSNIIRVRVFGPYGAAAALTGNWTMELQFHEL